MIQFPCRCGNVFRLEDEQAGASLQCPKCGLLNDAPLLEDLPRLAEDGTYKLDASEPAPKPRMALADLVQGLGLDPEDPKASAIDLRLTPEQIAHVGAPSAPPPTRPRYDPETGELIRPIDLLASTIPAVENPADIPFASPAITYTTRGLLPSDSWAGSVRVLCEPINIVVMLSGVVAELVTCFGLLYSIEFGFFVLTGLLFIFQLLLIAHFGNIIDETATEQRDDLPRLMRDLRLNEDIWTPLVGVLGGGFICYAPALVCAMAMSMDQSTFFKVSDVLLALGWLIGFCLVGISVIDEGLANINWTDHFVRPLLAVLVGSIICFLPAGLCIALHAGDPVFAAIALIASLAGTIILPGVLLTLTTSGSILNLSPSRLLASIRLCGRRYVSSLAAWIVAMILFVMGFAIAFQNVFGAPIAGFFGGKFSVSPLAYPLMACGLIVLHFCAFEIGMLYRKHHAAFPWVLQRHQPVHLPRRSAAIRSATTRVARARMVKK
jgi:hypothetical protein